MKTLELIGLCFGIGSCDTFLDDIAEKFNVELTIEDIELILNQCGRDYSNAGSMLAEMMFNKRLKEYGYQLYEDGWNADINGNCTHLYCDGTEIHDIAELRGMAEFKKNIDYLEENDISYCGDCGWDNLPYQAELETYTDAGEDMIIGLEKVDKEHLQDYIDGFDINEKVALWWPNGEKGNGVPFDNMKEQYEDYEAYLERLQEICDGMPY